MRTALFTHPAADFDRTVELLAGSWFAFAPPRRSQRTVLDTFDGRLHASGLRLEHVVGDDGRRLVLHADGSVPASIGRDAPPRFARDLPSGPFGARLRDLLDLRALLPLLSFDDATVTAVDRNDAGRVIATVIVHRPIVTARGEVGALVEVVEAAGHPHPAQRICRHLVDLGFVEHDGDLVSLVSRSSGVDLAGFTSEPTVPLERDRHAAPSFRAVLANLADTIDANWQGTIADIDTEFLHELRVAVRRTRSVIGQAKRVLPESVRSRFRDDFAWLAGATGPTRDLDVYTLEWPKYIAEMDPSTAAALQPVFDHIDHHRIAARAALVDVLQSERAAAVLSAWRRELATDPAERPSEATASIGRVVAKRFRQAHQTVLHQGRLIDESSPAEHLHDLRKDAKKLRYLVECFGSTMPNKLRKSFVKHLKGLQDNLGEHQDAEVHDAELRAVTDELITGPDTSPETLLALGRLAEHLQQAQRSARSEFAERFAEYDSAETTAIVDALLETLTAP